MGQTGCTSSCIGIAGVDDHGADALSTLQVLAAHLHRGGAEAVLSEHTGHAGAFVKQHHADVLAVGLAHAGFSDAPAHTGHGMQLRRIDGWQIHRHGILPSV